MYFERPYRTTTLNIAGIIFLLGGAAGLGACSSSDVTPTSPEQITPRLDDGGRYGGAKLEGLPPHEDSAVWLGKDPETGIPAVVYLNPNKGVGAVSALPYNPDCNIDSHSFVERNPEGWGKQRRFRSTPREVCPGGIVNEITYELIYEDTDGNGIIGQNDGYNPTISIVEK